MKPKTMIMFGMVIGSIAGGFFADLLSFGMFSFTGLFISSAGAVAGIYLAYRLTK
ncbi:MAG: hypothetical protein ABII64_00425 [Elusimicrobiota bacterium]